MSEIKEDVTMTETDVKIIEDVKMSDNKESKFKINSVKLISSWSYNLSTNVDCTICRYSLNSPSIYNLEKGLDSSIIKGLCGHAFHKECINTWTKDNKYCPLCFNTF